MSKVVIFGNSHWASLAHLYFKHDSPHDVVAFTVDREYLTDRIFEGLPVVPFDEVEAHYPPSEFDMFIPISFKKMGHLRADRYEQAKFKGYSLISYVSSKATTFPGFKCGDNCFILEDNTIQPYVQIGNDVVLWSGNHIGHHTVIKDHVTITSHVVISGSCVIESFSFLGVNATVRDETIIARDTLIGAGTVILKDSNEYEVYKAIPTPAAGFRSDQLRSISHKTKG
ncbi:MAG TPA: acetyltransferase [Planctomycetota bacterium]|nr:acetyltransferase [Planctomycetota bacterium]